MVKNYLGCLSKGRLIFFGQSIIDQDIHHLQSQLFDLANGNSKGEDIMNEIL
jgi:hypothetical protein